MWLVRDVALEFEQLRAMEPDLSRRFVRQAKRGEHRRHRTRTWVFVGVGTASAAVAMLALALAPASTPYVSRSMSLNGILTLAIVVGVMAAGPVFSLGLLLWLDRGWVKRSIRSRLAKPTCSKCGFSLAGLPVERCLARCPECGAEQVVVGNVYTAVDELA